MSWPLKEYEPDSKPLTAGDSRNLSELHDAYRMFCEYGWHHLTWKNLAYSLAIYLSADFKQRADGQLLHTRPDAARSDYLAHLNVEAFGYLTKDTLWVLFQRTDFNSDYELNLCYHRPFEVPAWQYLFSLPYSKLRILIVDIANILRERTTSSHACANILSLAPDWRPTFGAEYGIFQFLEADLSPNDVTSLRQLQINRNAFLKPVAHGRPKGFLKRALSIRNIQDKNKMHFPESSGEESQNRKRFSWPLTDRYKRLFPRKRNAEAGTQATDITIKPKPIQVSIPTLKVVQTVHLGSTSPTSTVIPFVEQQTNALFETVSEEDTCDAESIKSSNTMDSLLHFYAQGLQYSTPTCKELDRSAAATLEVLRPDSPILAPATSVLISRTASLKSTITKETKERPVSPSSGHQSFLTANTRASSQTPPRTVSRLTGRSSPDSFLSFESMFSDTLGLPASSPYYKLLKDHDLIPEPAIAIDWSGRGQHAEYTPNERSNIPLRAEKLLGRTRTAVVESVRCKRVRLVRKTVKCTKWTGMKQKDLLREVQHLHRAQHAHIVRLVGTYVVGPDLAILTYPCAEWNLEQFMDFARTAHHSSANCAAALRQFFTCTAKVLDFLHSFPIKHMDIKPQNLLVRDVQGANQYKLYLTDFGISRAYESVDDCNTESPTSFTRAYAAREVVVQECRGLSADIFSLGCVYAEMLAARLDASIAAGRTTGERVETYWTSLRVIRHSPESGVRPYHCATKEVRSWLSTLPMDEEPEMLAVRDWASAMMSNEAHTRPTARQIADDPRLPFACLSCNMRRGPEDFEAAEPFAVTPRQASPHDWERPVKTILEVPALA